MDLQELATATMEAKEDDGDESFIPNKDEGSTTEEEGGEPEAHSKNETDEHTTNQADHESNEGVEIKNELSKVAEADQGGQAVKEIGINEDITGEGLSTDKDIKHDATSNDSKQQGGKKRKKKASKKEPKKPKAPKVKVTPAEKKIKHKGKHSSLEERQLVIDMMQAGKTVADVARELGRSRQYVTFWWNRRSEDALTDKPRPGRPQGPSAPGKDRFIFDTAIGDDFTTHGIVLDENMGDEKIFQDEEDPTTEVKWYKCMTCNVTYTWKESMDNMPPTVDEQYKCPQCDEQLEKQDPPKVPKKRGRLPSNEPRIYACQFCQKQFKAKSHLKAHERSHTGEKPYKCNFCDKGFAQQAGVKAHEKIHTGEKPFKCDQCNKSFTEKGTLKRHLWMHTGEKPYMCQYCGKKFTSSGNLNAHARTHTGQLALDGETPPLGGQSFYPCTYCNKTFVWPWHLKRHIQIHSGDKPFMCQFCGKKFARRDGLREHERVHTGEKPYECQYCEKAFATATPLRVHERVHARRGDNQARMMTSGADANTITSGGGTSVSSSVAGGAIAVTTSQDVATFFQSIIGQQGGRHGFQSELPTGGYTMAHLAAQLQQSHVQPALQELTQVNAMNHMQQNLVGASTTSHQPEDVHQQHLAQQPLVQLQNVPYEAIHSSTGLTTTQSLVAGGHLSMPSIYTSHGIANMPSSIQSNYEIKCEPSVSNQSTEGMVTSIPHHVSEENTAATDSYQTQLLQQHRDFLSQVIDPTLQQKEHLTQISNSLKEQVAQLSNTIALQTLAQQSEQFNVENIAMVSPNQQHSDNLNTDGQQTDQVTHDELITSAQNQAQVEIDPINQGRDHVAEGQQTDQVTHDELITNAQNQAHVEIDHINQGRDHVTDGQQTDQVTHDELITSAQNQAQVKIDRIDQGGGHDAQINYQITDEHEIMQEDHHISQDDHHINQGDQQIIPGDHQITQDNDPITQHSHHVLQDSHQITQESDHTVLESDHLVQESDHLKQESDHIIEEFDHHSQENYPTRDQPLENVGLEPEQVQQLVDTNSEENDPVRNQPTEHVGFEPEQVQKHIDSNISDKIDNPSDNLQTEDVQSMESKVEDIKETKPEDTNTDPVKTTLLESIGLHKSSESPVKVKRKKVKTKIIHRKPPTTEKSGIEHVISEQKKDDNMKLLIKLPKPVTTVEPNADNKAKVLRNVIRTRSVARRANTAKIVRSKRKQARPQRLYTGAIKKDLIEVPVKKGRGKPRVKGSQPKETKAKPQPKTRNSYAPAKVVLKKQKKLTALKKVRKERQKQIRISHSCSYCPSVFKSLTRLKIHERVHTGEKPFQCKYCDKSFAQPAGIRTHERIHTGEKPYQCNHCEKSFRENGSLKIHQRTHTGEKPFMCSSCGRRFTNSGNLRTHEKVHGIVVGEDGVPTEENLYSCKHCDKKFQWPWHLKRHQAIHSGDKPHVCPFCGKAYARRDHLREHERSHTGEKPYSCKYCQKCFAVACSLRAHEKTHLLSGASSEGQTERRSRNRKSKITKEPSSHDSPSEVHHQVKAYYESWRKDLLDLTGRPLENMEIIDRAGEQENTSHSNLAESVTISIRTEEIDGEDVPVDTRPSDLRPIAIRQVHLEHRNQEAIDLEVREAVQGLDKQEEGGARIELNRHIDSEELGARQVEDGHIEIRHAGESMKHLEERQLGLESHQIEVRVIEDTREIEQKQFEARAMDMRQLEVRQMEARELEARQLEARQHEVRQFEARQVEAARHVEVRPIEAHHQLDPRHLEAIEGRIPVAVDPTTGRPAMLEAAAARAWGHEYATIDPRMHMQAYEYPPAMHIGHAWAQAHKHT